MPRPVALRRPALSRALILTRGRPAAAGRDREADRVAARPDRPGEARQRGATGLVEGDDRAARQPFRGPEGDDQGPTRLQPGGRQRDREGVDHHGLAESGRAVATGGGQDQAVCPLGDHPAGAVAAVPGPANGAGSLPAARPGGPHRMPGGIEGLERCGRGAGQLERGPRRPGQGIEVLRVERAGRPAQPAGRPVEP